MEKASKELRLHSFWKTRIWWHKIDKKLESEVRFMIQPMCNSSLRNKNIKLSHRWYHSYITYEAAHKYFRIFIIFLNELYPPYGKEKLLSPFIIKCQLQCVCPCICMKSGACSTQLCFVPVFLYYYYDFFVDNSIIVMEEVISSFMPISIFVILANAEIILFARFHTIF